jgi:DNA-binding GntR family transcriptional regulator
MLDTRRQQVYRYIHSRLLDGTFSPNQRLLPAALAREIGVSLVPVREAINQLQNEGLVVQAPHHGVFVRSTGRQEYRELMELRRVLECNAAARAARWITDVALDELKKYLDELHRIAGAFPAELTDHERSQLAHAWMTTDLKFHMVLLRAAHNRAVIKALNEANALTQMVGRRTDVPGVRRDPAFFMANYTVHGDIFEAVSRHDSSGAKRAMANHMRRAQRNTLAWIDWLQYAPAGTQDHLDDFLQLT